MSIRIKWNDCDETMANQLSGITFTPGRLHPFPVDALQESIQRSMPGLKSAYVSGYLDPKATVDPTISGLGELAVIRDDQGITKSYNFLFAKDDKGKIHFAGPYIDFPEHHWSGNASLPISEIFGNTLL